MCCNVFQLLQCGAVCCSELLFVVLCRSVAPTMCFIVKLSDIQCWRAALTPLVLAQKSSTSQPYISAKESRMQRWRCAEMTSAAAKEPYNAEQTSPTSPQKSPVYLQKSPVPPLPESVHWRGVMTWRAVLRWRVCLTRQRLFLLLSSGILHQTAGTFILESPHPKIYIHMYMHMYMHLVCVNPYCLTIVCMCIVYV